MKHDLLAEMSIAEIRAASKMLALAADEFANHGCNDLKWSELPDFVTQEQRAALETSFSEWNGDSEEADGSSRYFSGGDSGLMQYLAAKLKATADRAEIQLDEKINDRS